MNQINETSKRHQKIPEQWLKGIGLFLLIVIYLAPSLKTIFQEEQYDRNLYLLLLISIPCIPIVLSNVLDFISLRIAPIINQFYSRSDDSHLEVILSTFLSLTFNVIVIIKLLTEGTLASFKYYFLLYFFRDIVKNNLPSTNFLRSVFLGAVLTMFLGFLCFLLIKGKSSLKYLAEYIIVTVVTLLTLIVAHDIIYIDKGSSIYGGNSNYHLNVVLFPLTAFISKSPSTPLVSDGFISLYGGYFLWMGWLLKFMGNSLSSIKFLLLIIIALQIVLYFIISKCLLRNSFVRILVFLTGIFWSYFYGKVVTHDLYFQYFPLRTLFPSIFIVVSFYTSIYFRKFFNKVIFSHSFFRMTWQDLLLDFIVAFAILNNLDSGLSVISMYLFFYNWNFLRSVSSNFQIKSLAKQLIGFLINFAVITLLLITLFRLMLGDFPDFSLLTSSTSKFSKGFFGLPFPDNLWMFYIVLYAFTLVKSLSSTVDDINAKYRFSVAIWGIVSFLYFVNRSHPWNLLAISLPFFLCCGFFIEQSLDLLMNPKEPAQASESNQTELITNINNILSNRLNRLKIYLYGVWILPIIMTFLIAILWFLPLTVYHFQTPKTYSQIANSQKLSDEVAILERQLNRPSIILSKYLESFYYLVNERPVLFYPETTSIFDSSYKVRFTNVLNTLNPIVVICPIADLSEIGTKPFLEQSLRINQFKRISSKLNPEEQENCQIYIRE